MASERLALIGGNVMTPEAVIANGVVVIRDGVLESVTDSGMLRGSVREIDCRGKIVMPGFIDVHTHGGIGLDFADEDPTVESRLSEYYYRHGTTTVLATLCPLPMDRMITTLERIAAYCRGDGRDSNIYGIHIEGPYLNKSMRGGNAEEYIVEPGFDSWRRIKNAGGDCIKMVTVAPELLGIGETIRDAVKSGIVVSLGHSTANGKETAAAIALGATQATHLFNAMPKLHHREEGMLAEILLSPNVDAQIIADGIHVNPRIIELAVRLKSAGHILLITDSMRAAQLADGSYPSAGNTVTVKQGISRLEDGTLAGSTQVFESGVKLVVREIGLDLPAVSRMSSLNAARSLGIGEQTGSIETNKAADIVVLDQDFNVWMTIHRGTVKYERSLD
jgi:N-acetylglucosamine-6-phosphate deacetylase